MFIDLKNIIDTVWVKPRVEIYPIPIILKYKYSSNDIIRMYNIVIKFKNKYVYQNYKNISDEILYIASIDDFYSKSFNEHLDKEDIFPIISSSRFSFYEDYNKNSLDLYITQNKEHYMLYVNDTKLYSKLKMLIE